MNKFEELQKVIADAKASIFSEMDELLESCQEDADKFYDKGNRSAGGRIRKTAQSVRKLLHFPTIRKTLSSIEETAKDLRSTINEPK